MEDNPTLVQQESPAIAFWHAAVQQQRQQQQQEQNVQSKDEVALIQLAACNLAAVWKWRRSFFGEARWLRPMTLQGAMAADQAFLELGLLYLLPEPDQHGRRVFFYNKTGFTAKVAPRAVLVRTDLVLYLARDSFIQSKQQQIHSNNNNNNNRPRGRH